jgi:hypothetical protein
MIKLTIAIAVLLAAGLVWLRAQWARSKNSNAANEIINDLQSGKFVIESYADALGIMICSKALPQAFDPGSAKVRLQELAGKKIRDQYSIRYADMNAAGKGIVIAEAASKDIVAGYGGNKEIDIHFPCWIYIDARAEANVVDFRSTFPENKDHHFLLEDFASEIHHRL